MKDKVLIAYATKYGSTREVAERIGRVFGKEGIPNDVHDVKTVKNIDGYTAVVLGTAVFMNKLLSAAVRFADRNRRALQDMPVAYFTLGVTMKTDNPENREQATKYLERLCNIKTPVSMGLFAGKLDYRKIGAFFRWSFKKDTSGLLGEGDFRDWEIIKSWAKDIIPKLSVTSSVAAGAAAG